MTDALSISLLATLCLSVAAALFTAMLRVGGVGLRPGAGPGGYRGTAIIGGIVAGLLAGPGVLGQVAPELHRRAFVGAVSESNAYTDLLARQRADIAAMKQAGVTGVAIEELAARHEQERSPASQRVMSAERERRELLDAIASVVAGACLFAACIGLVPNHPRPRRLLARTARTGFARLGLSAGVLVLLGVGVPALVTSYFVGTGGRTTFAFSLVIGAIGASGALGASLRWIASLSALFAWFVAGVIAPTPVYFGLSAAIALGLALGALPSRAIRRIAIVVARWAALPALSALLAVRIDLHSAQALPGFWFMVIGSVLWCSDGRWFAARMAIPVAGVGDRAWSRAAWLVNAGPGTITLVLALVFSNAGIAGEAMLASALAGAAVVELFRGFRAFAGPVLDG